MRHSIVLTLVLLAVQGTVLVDAFDFLNFLSNAVPLDKIFPRQNNNDNSMDGLKKDNDLLKTENAKLSDSLKEEKGARNQTENTLKEVQDLNETFKQAIETLENQLVEAQQQLETCNEEHANCTSENEVLGAKVEQFKYSLEKCEQDKEDRISELDEEIKNILEEVEDCEHTLSSCRRDSDDFVAMAIQRQRQFTESLKSAAAESSAIEATYASLDRSHDLSCEPDGSGFSNIE